MPQEPVPLTQGGQRSEGQVIDSFSRRSKTCPLDLHVTKKRGFVTGFYSFFYFFFVVVLISAVA